MQIYSSINQQQKGSNIADNNNSGNNTLLNSFQGVSTGGSQPQNMSSILHHTNPLNVPPSPTSIYQQLNEEYIKNGFTYKSNEILLKLNELSPREYPYLLLLQIAKTYHMNQFEIIFLSHILQKVEPCYSKESQIFTDQMELSEEARVLIDQVFDSYLMAESGSQNKSQSKFKEKTTKSLKRHNENEVDQGNNNNDILNQIDNSHQQPENISDQQDEDYHHNHHSLTPFRVPQLRKVYMYLLVMGYAVKYYLNEQTKIRPYEQFIRKTHPNFFTAVFNRWAKTYGNTVLATTPRNINTFYSGLGFMGADDDPNEDQPNEDCQHRNYNEIVDELIKATTDGEDQQGIGGSVGMELGDERDQNNSSIINSPASNIASNAINKGNNKRS